jgi:hypothetical protein
VVVVVVGLALVVVVLADTELPLALREAIQVQNQFLALSQELITQ